MTTRVQALRSSTSGALPAAGVRLPGELFANFSDLQLGVIDGSKNPQKLIAVRFFSASANYAIGDFVIQAGSLYVANSAVTAGAFNASKWNKIVIAGDLSTLPYLPIAGGTLTGALTLAGDPGAALGAATKQYVDTKAGAYLPLAGGTMTGALTLAADPVAAMQPATKQYVDGGRLGDNRIINGDMRIDQRNNGASGTAINYTVDRWFYQASQTAKGTWQRNLSSMPGFPYYLGFTSSSAYVAVAGDVFSFHQRIEADMVSDFAWGTASAQPVTLSFWAYSNQSGAFSGAITGASPARSYPFTYSLSANAWTRIVLTIPGDTAGAWTLFGNTEAFRLYFDLGSGANFRGPANAWAAANYLGATGSVSIVGVSGALFYVTGVKLEVGSVATPFNRQSLAKSMVDCQRYYQTGNVARQGYATTSVIDQTTIPLNVTMRASPTITPTWTTQTNCGASAEIAISPSATAAYTTVTASAAFVLLGTFTASAEL